MSYTASLLSKFTVPQVEIAAVPLAAAVNLNQTSLKVLSLPELHSAPS